MVTWLRVIGLWLKVKKRGCQISGILLDISKGKRYLMTTCLVVVPSVVVTFTA